MKAALDHVKKLPLEFLIAGIGNYTMPYTRHSAGLLVVNNLAKNFNLTLKSTGKTKCLTAETTVRVPSGRDGQEVRLVLASSQVLMNLSGNAVLAAYQHFFSNRTSRLLSGAQGSSNVIVLHDDLDLAPMQVRRKASGSARGHNGVTDVMRALKTDVFWRIRLGIGEYNRQERRDMVSFVLGDLTGAERRFWGEPGAGLEGVWAEIEAIIKDAAGTKSKDSRRRLKGPQRTEEKIQQKMEEQNSTREETP
ncbi:peptidyl-tRNA hydrolase [Dacryopinax primogenitus]|uniref:Peptidyl-tRNA hydrolase n=1 Tax=Dacryopinax primogenitus (strain DJM 731) TaxID=1858805 RepID=M5GA94_DACPD|nr:peptidyl-tRNA hydrolase [Dacryopinax primogenitus]EJU05250.1 peptidyl-tRNA hydrolase [Dacryopinax primogenitus]